MLFRGCYLQGLDAVLCCFWSIAMKQFRRRYVTDGRMTSSIVVVVNIAADSIAHQCSLAPRVKIHILGFQRPTESFYPGVVATAPTAVHADCNSISFKCVYPLLTGILTSLVWIDNFRFAMLLNSPVQHFDGVGRLKGWIQAPLHNIAAVHIDITNMSRIWSLYCLHSKKSIQISSRTKHRWNWSICILRILILPWKVPRKLCLHIWQPPNLKRFLPCVRGVKRHPFSILYFYLFAHTIIIRYSRYESCKTLITGQIGLEWVGHNLVIF